MRWNGDKVPSRANDAGARGVPTARTHGVPRNAGHKSCSTNRSPTGRPANRARTAGSHANRKKCGVFDDVLQTPQQSRGWRSTSGDPGLLLVSCRTDRRTTPCAAARQELPHAHPRDYGSRGHSPEPSRPYLRPSRSLVSGIFAAGVFAGALCRGAIQSISLSGDRKHRFAPMELRPRIGAAELSDGLRINCDCIATALDRYVDCSVDWNSCVQRIPEGTRLPGLRASLLSDFSTTVGPEEQACFD